jgi:hypothetical protein
VLVAPSPPCGCTVRVRSHSAHMLVQKKGGFRVTDAATLQLNPALLGRGWWKHSIRWVRVSVYVDTESTLCVEHMGCKSVLCVGSRLFILLCCWEPSRSAETCHPNHLQHTSWGNIHEACILRRRNPTRHASTRLRGQAVSQSVFALVEQRAQSVSQSVSSTQAGSQCLLQRDPKRPSRPNASPGT